jgi:hypothetical protein
MARLKADTAQQLLDKQAEIDKLERAHKVDQAEARKALVEME